jgi:plasmid stabilization system protein ParE
MSHRVIYRRIAQREFDEAVDYYEQRQTGLGERFADAVQSIMRRISRNPLAHAIVYKDVRKAVVQRFPYVIYYRVETTQVIVIAVFHSKRNPKIWKSRQ